MKTSVTGGIARFGFAISGELSGLLEVVFEVVGVVVFIDEILAGVIGRVDIYHFDFARVGAFEDFEDFKVIAFDVEILRGIPIFGFLGAGAQCSCRGFLRFVFGLLFAAPTEFVSFVFIDDEFLDVFGRVVFAHGFEQQIHLQIAVTECVRADLL